MTVNVGPTEAYPTHHISLTDGTNTLGLVLCDGQGKPVDNIQESGVPPTVLRVSQGAGGYGDFEYPYTPVVQSDWAGGRGVEDFETDTTRYGDSLGIDTTRGDITLGPGFTRGTGYYTEVGQLETKPSSWVEISYGVAQRYTPGSTHTAYTIGVWMDAGIENSACVIAIYSDDGDEPGTLLQQSFLPLPVLDQERIYFPFTFTFTAGTTYWIVLSATGTGFKVGLNLGSGTTLKTLDSVWESLLGSMPFVLSPLGKTRAFYFQYHGSLFAVVNGKNGTAPHIYMNGYHGMALSNTGTLDRLITASGATWTNSFADVGDVIQVVRGKGIDEDPTWRSVYGLVGFGIGEDKAVTVEPSWDIEQDTTTEWATLGVDSWVEVTGHGMTKAVTDVLVSGEIVYFCQGESWVIRQGTMTAGVWSWAWEGTSETAGTKASMLREITNTEGKRKVWRVLSSESKVSNADPVAALGSTMTFVDEIVCGNPNTRVINLIAYGSPQIPWILKEDEFGSINNKVYAAVPLGEMRHVRDERNGRAALQHGVYLYLSLLNGVERYYEQRLDDMGPNLDEGFPVERQGNITKLLGYPGRIYAAIDGGQRGYSCVICHNGTGWHEIYRGAFGRRIRDIFIQVIPGNFVDRLWLAEDEELIWIPLSSNPRKTSGYVYAKEGTITSAWINGSMRDVVKYFDNATLFADGLSASINVTMEYQSDAETVWHSLTETIEIHMEDGSIVYQTTEPVFDTSPSEKHDLSSLYDVTGKRLRYRLTLHGNGVSTPRIKAFLLNSVTRIPPKRAWRLTYMIDDYGMDLTRMQTTLTAQQILNQLRTWADSRQGAKPLTLHHNLGLFDDIRVFVDPTSVSPLQTILTPERTVRMLGRLSLSEA